MTHVDTYYTPAGNEHVRAERSPAAEQAVARRLKKGDHVHTWSLRDGLRCPTNKCVDDK